MLNSIPPAPLFSSSKWLSCQRGALVALSLSTTSCVVWKTDYDTLASRQRDEAAAHAVARQALSDSQQELVALQTKVERLEQQLSDSQRRLDANAESLAQAEFQHGVVEQQKQEATELVNQLRSELERLTTHFQAYASDRETLNVERERLSRELEQAELRLQALAVAQQRAQQRLEMVRDLSLRLRQEIEREQLSLLFDGDIVVLRFSPKQVFGKSGLSSEGKRILRAVGRALLGESADTADGSRKDARREATGATVSEAPPPSLVINEWDKGQRLRLDPKRLKWTRDALLDAGLGNDRFGDQTVLQAYRDAVQTALVQASSAGSESDADAGQTATVTDGPAPPELQPFAPPGSSLTIHLVPITG